MECLGFTSMVFLETMYEVMELSRRACAFIIRSMLADQPYSEVVSTHGESAMRLLTMTFSTLSPSTSFMSFVRGSNSAFSSSIFFFSSSSSMSKPSFVTDFNFFAVELLELLYGVFVDGVHHVDDFQTFLAQIFQERRGGDTSDTLASNVVDVVLAFLHAVDVLLKTDHLVSRLGSLVSHELSDLGAVRGVFVHAKLEALAELLVELFIIILLFGNFGEHLEAFLDEILFDHAENLILLQGFTGDVEWQILGVNDALNKVQPLWHEFVTIIHDEDAANI